MSLKLGIILGSVRVHSNTSALVTYLQTLISIHHPSIHVELVNLQTSSGHPLPLQTDDVIPASYALSQLPDIYALPATRAWSSTVLGWDGVLIVTPQYNWGPPAALKNAFDHLFSEWVGLPAGIVTAGARGGGKCRLQLKEIMGGGLKMSLVGEGKGVEVVCPGEYIRTEKRLKGNEEVVRGYEGEMVELLKDLVAGMNTRKGEKEEIQQELGGETKSQVKQ